MGTTGNDSTIKFSSNDRIGDYIPGERLGGGEHSSTFKAVNRITNEIVAIKVFAKSSSLSKNLYEAEINAYETLRGLSGILQLKDNREIDDYYLIVTEFVQEGSLRNILNKHSEGMNFEDALELFALIAATIDRIHGKNVIHRDLKPENVLVRKFDQHYEIFITDFGIVKFTTESHQFKTGHMAGTLWYSPPESLIADPDIPQTEAVDIYALGVMLYEALEGKKPFNHSTGVLESDAPIPARTKRKINREVAELVLRALSRNPLERPLSALDYIEGMKNAYKLSLNTEQKWVGRKIKNYVVEEVLPGSGSMGISLRARDTQTNNQVVLKAFVRSPLSEIAIQAYKKERKSLDRLTNEHGVLIPRDGFEYDRVLFIVTDYQNGGTLRNLLNRRPKLDTNEILEIFAQIAEAIDYIHDKKIVHRDIKPENVVYNKNEGKVNTFITDFGVSVLLANTQASFKTRGIGTPRYMAPELWDPNAKGTKAVDIYAFGLMLYEAFEGHLPSRAKTLSISRKQDVHGTSVPVPEKVLKALGENARKILFQALDTDPGERPKTATEIMKQISGQHAMFLGKTYGKYTIENFVGRGTYGATYRAYDVNKRPRKKFAFKVLSIPEPIMHEIDELKKIGHHEGILPILEGKSENGIHYVVTEYLKGINLRDMLQGYRLGMNLDEALKIFSPIAKALDYLHSNGIVHGDLIPSNIILCKNKNEEDSLRPIITGFGISKIAGKVQPFHSKINYNYIAPELWEDGNPSPASDIYAFGVMLYETLEGVPPFDAKNLAGIMRQHLYENPPVPRNLHDSSGKAATRVLLQSLDKKPERRQKSATEIISQLEDLIQNRTPTSLGPISGPLITSLRPIINAGNKKIEISISRLATYVAILIAIFAFVLSQCTQPPTPIITPISTDSTQSPTSTITATGAPPSPTATITPTPTITPTSPAPPSCAQQYSLTQEECDYTIVESNSLEKFYTQFYGNRLSQYDLHAIAYYNNRRALEETRYNSIDPKKLKVEPGWTIFLPSLELIKEYDEFPIPVLDEMSQDAANSEIKISGSSTLDPLSKKIEEGFERAKKGYQVNIESNNTILGLADFCQGRAHLFGASEENLKNCPNVTFLKFEIARYAVVIFINEKNPDRSKLIENPLNAVELNTLLTTAKTWKEVRSDLSAEPIKRYYPSRDSGDFEIVRNEIFPTIDPDAILNLEEIEDENSIPDKVIQDDYSIGISSHINYQNNTGSLTAISVNGVSPNPETIMREIPTYPLTRKLYLYTGEVTYRENPLLRFFINYYLAYEFDYLNELGYFPPSKSGFLNNPNTTP